MDVKNGKVPQVTQPAKEYFYKAYNISYYGMKRADAVKWLNNAIRD
jgi:hypothetical protein